MLNCDVRVPLLSANCFPIVTLLAGMIFAKFLNILGQLDCPKSITYICSLMNMKILINRTYCEHFMKSLCLAVVNIIKILAICLYGNYTSIEGTIC